MLRFLPMKKFLQLCFSLCCLATVVGCQTTPMLGDKAPAYNDNVCMYNDVSYKPDESYYDGCNWHTCQDDGSFVGTEIGCEEYGEQKNSWEQ